MLPGLGAAIPGILNAGGDGVPYSAVVLNLFGEGADGNQTFVDHSIYGRTLTANNTVQNDTGVDVHGESILFGSNSKITTPDAAEFDISSNKFCLEAYIRTTNLSHINMIYEKRGSEEFAFQINQTTGTITFVGWWSGAIIAVNATSTTSVSLNTVHHVAAIGDGSTSTVFIDGVPGGSAAISNFIQNTGDPLWIGGAHNAARFFEGNMNWLRFTVGYSRYPNGGFTPPSTPFPTS